MRLWQAPSSAGWRGANRGLRALVWAGLACCALCAAGAAETPPAGTGGDGGRGTARLLRVREVRRLSAGAASAGRAVQLRGAVTALSGWRDSFFLQDEASGISVDRLDHSPEVKAGDRVEVRGITAGGSFAPIVLARWVRVTGRAEMPPARVYGAGELAGGAADSQWVAMHGNVRAAEVKTVWGRPVLLLKLDIGSDTLVDVHVREFTQADAARLAGATVTIRGACGTIFNDRRQAIGLRLFTGRAGEVQVDKAAPTDSFAVPERRLADLFVFSDEMKVAEQIKVRGVVTWSKAGEGFYLQDGTQAAYVDRAGGWSIERGTRVEVVGYPVKILGLPALRASRVRVVPDGGGGGGENGAGVRAAAHRAAEMITMRDGFVSTPYAGQLVTVEGLLLDEVPGAQVHTLLLQEGSEVFRAILPTRLLQAGAQRGSMVRVTGICSLRLDEETGEASSFGILMRDRGDLVVLRRAPWWNETHALECAALVIVVLLGVAVWAVVSRRRAELKSLVLTDPLTRLYNRRGFELLAHKHTQIAQRRRAEMLLFYFDLDHFKEINDTFGHREGDRALQQVAGALQRTFRESDIVGRLGGDEFAVIAVDATAENRSTLLGRLQQELETMNAGAGQPFRIEISTGVVVCRPEDAERTLEDLLNCADALMYEQKRKRRQEERKVSYA